MIEVEWGTGDAKHKFYIIFPCIVFKDGIILLRDNNAIEFIKYDFPLDNPELQG